MTHKRTEPRTQTQRKETLEFSLTHKRRHTQTHINYVTHHKANTRPRETQRDTDLHTNVNRRSRKLLRHQKFSAHIHIFYSQLDFPSEPGVANEILPKSCLTVA